MNTTTEQLIELIKKHRILYDLSHPEYKNTRIKNKVWDEIGALLKIDGEDAKKRWKNIRDCYAKHLRSEKTHTGQKAKNIDRYRSWPWAAQMSAFKPFLLSNVEETVNEDTQSSQEENHLSRRETETYELTETYENSSDVDRSRSSANTTENSTITPHLLKKTAPKRKFVRENNESSVSQVLSYLKNKDNNSQGTSYDDLHLLFLGHAKAVKKLSSKRQAVAKYRVAQVIMEEELRDIEETTTGSSFSVTTGTRLHTPSGVNYQQNSTCPISNQFSNSPLNSYAATSPPESDNSQTCSEATTWYETFSRRNL
ncbi:transcription factor Adf-1-like [Anthonomus grandis grandis]|uniref:transcription factor Adf-1-like n=1 Tax=Anthonomus grandis grandis TaxID=2921223 RepID=UPI002165AE10|nr:transcription factor Adf-1-like [Anthonomus grandis grandis]